MESSAFAPVGQTFATTPSGQLGTHTFLAPAAAVNDPVVEVPASSICNPAPEFDCCDFRSLGGAIQWLVRLAICLSVASCVARTDFTLPVLFYAYYEWSLAGEWEQNARVYRIENKAVHQIYDKTASLLTASAATIRGVQCANAALVVATVLDWLWILSATFSWTCLFSRHRKGRECLASYPGLRRTYHLHALVLCICLINAVSKTAIVGMTWGWLKVQNNARKFLERTYV